MKKTLLSVLLVFVAFLSFAELNFQGLDLNSNNKLLFSAQVSIPGGINYPVLFSYDLDKSTAVQLTWYPESLEILDQGRILQVRNRFGVVRYQNTNRKLTWLEGFTSFIKGASVTAGTLPPFTPSPNGKFVVYWESDSFAYGKLVFQDLTTNKSSVIAENVERCFDSPCVLWSADSSAFIYENNGNLYFSRPELYSSEANLVEEKYRIIGKGTLDNVAWYSPSRFLYLSGDSVYSVAVSELFARSLYSDLIGIGSLCGKLSFSFEAGHDSFWVSPDGKSILISRNNRDVYYIDLLGDVFSQENGGTSRPSLALPANCANVFVFWSSSAPVVITESIENGNKVCHAFRVIKKDSKTGLKGFVSLQLPADVTKFVLSPSGRKLAMASDNAIFIYDFEKWSQVAQYTDEPSVSFAWGDEVTLYVGGTKTVRAWNIIANTSDILFFSTVSNYGWSENGDSVVVECGNRRYIQTPSGVWNDASAVTCKKTSTQNDLWRVYLDVSTNDVYKNTIFRRNNVGTSNTIQLIKDPVLRLDSLTEVDDTLNETGALNHGSRNRCRQVALTFDALDNAEGLSTILYTLKKYNIKATFFINGEFIRRHPKGVKEIVASGHQIGSMFFTPFDINNVRYRVDADFISRGLARNEDEFYALTNSELSLLWHPAFYAQSDVILQAGKESGYTYVGYDVDSLDWVVLEDSATLQGLYFSSSKLVEKILQEKKPGSIIPIRVGKPDGSRKDFLYEKLDLLINGLLESGYEIVTISELQKNIR